MRASAPCRSAERIPADPDGVRLAQIEARLGELRTAEEAFLRTRRELAEHTDAISAREQLLAQRERELDEREDGWGGADLHELESPAPPARDPAPDDADRELQRRLPPPRAGRLAPPAADVIGRTEALH